jgi:hypothetical protein
MKPLCSPTPFCGGPVSFGNFHSRATISFAAWAYLLSRDSRAARPSNSMAVGSDDTPAVLSSMVVALWSGVPVNGFCDVVLPLRGC